MEAQRSPLTREDLCAAFETLREVTPEHALARMAPTGPAAVYTTLVTLWLLTAQRLGGGCTLSLIVKDVVEHSKCLLPKNKRVREGRLSLNSGAYSEARKRLPLPVVEFFAHSVCQALIDRVPSWFGHQRAFIIDGTTFTVAPTSELTRVFPPSTNQHGVTVWPVVMMLVAHELQTGCALVPEIGAMYGKDNTSESRMAMALAKRIPANSIVLADAGFGIFSVCHAMVRQGHDILFRLTASRFKALRRKAECIDQTDSSSMYRLRWVPSAADRLSNPGLPSDAELEVYLHEVRLANGETLMLVTTLHCPSEKAAEIYCRRYDVEHDIRDVKVTMGLENIRAKSLLMVQKELLCSVVAYNLVQEFRRQAASLAGIRPRRLSFTGVWDTFRVYLLQQPPTSYEGWLERYEKALKVAAKDKLPNRPGRAFPRKAHKRCQKSTKFMTKTASSSSNTPAPQARSPTK